MKFSRLLRDFPESPLRRSPNESVGTADRRRWQRAVACDEVVDERVAVGVRQVVGDPRHARARPDRVRVGHEPRQPARFDAGADVARQDADGYTPSALAAARGHAGCARLVRRRERDMRAGATIGASPTLLRSRNATSDAV